MEVPNENSEIDVMNHIKEIWTSKPFQLYIPILDLQHIWLLNLIVQLELINLREDSEEKEVKLQEILSELIDFTIEHFSVEEQLFESFNFPETSEHKKQHQKFIFFIEDRVKEKNSKNETDFLEKLINFLKKWLFSHILNEDKKYQKFLQNRNIDAAPVFKKLLNSGETRLSRKQITIYNYVADNSDLIEAREKNETTYIYKLWKTYSLSTDIPILDIQHLWLIKIIVELEQGIQTNDNKKRELQFQKSIYQAIEYSKYHFYTEELIMKEFNYPALDTHVSYHRKFTSFLGFRLKQKKEGIYSAIYGLVSDLKEWLISHIAIEDKKLLSFYKDKEEELSIFIKKMIQENKLQIENEHLRLYANILKKEK